MSYRELIEALHRGAEERIGEFRREAVAEASRFREEAADGLERMRKEFSGRQAVAVREASRDILADAESKARHMRLADLRELSERLSCLAVAMIAGLREKGYEELFCALARELPVCPWETVKVNPEDEEMARRHFPRAKIVTEPGISGGMEVCGEGGRICIVNTLDKRLERGWPELLPDLVAAAYREIGRDAFAQD